MITDTAEQYLRALFVEAGVDLKQPTFSDVEQTFTVFRKFMEVPCEDAGSWDEECDALTARYAIYTGVDTTLFAVSLIRQLVDPESEVEHAVHVHAHIKWPVIAEHEEFPEGELESYPLSVDEFFAQARELPGFKWALASNIAPTEISVETDWDA